MTTGGPDFFDRIMASPIFRIFEPFYKDHKEILLYLLFGGICFLISTSLFWLFVCALKINELFSNAVVWIVCVLFQFFTNRIWVFDGKVKTAGEFAGQLLAFSGGRLFTLAVEEIILAVFITWLAVPALPVKLAAQIVVIILNYIISKVWVFTK